MKGLTKYHMWGHFSSFSMISILDGCLWLFLKSLLTRLFTRCCSARRTLESFISLWCTLSCGSVDLFATDRCSMWNQSSFICNNTYCFIWIPSLWKYHRDFRYFKSVRKNDWPGIRYSDVQLEVNDREHCRAATISPLFGRLIACNFNEGKRRVQVLIDR